MKLVSGVLLMSSSLFAASSIHDFTMRTIDGKSESLADFKGKRLAVNRGSPYEQWSQENHEKYGFQFNVFPTNADAIQAVLSGRADANMAGVPAQAWAAKHQGC